MFALDFVSLLLSKYTPRQAETSISAFLKQVAPLGTLNAEVVNAPPRPDSVGTDIRTVSRGWRLQSFNSAAQKLLKAASRLDDEVASETRYWNEILAVKENGWKVCRLPRERQALGVQFGFLEGERGHHICERNPHLTVHDSNPDLSRPRFRDTPACDRWSLGFRHRTWACDGPQGPRPDTARRPCSRTCKDYDSDGPKHRCYRRPHSSRPRCAI